MLKFHKAIKMSINEIFNMYFGIIEDEGDQANVKHPLVDILKLVTLAVLCRKYHNKGKCYSQSIMLNHRRCIPRMPAKYN